MGRRLCFATLMQRVCQLLEAVKWVAKEETEGGKDMAWRALAGFPSPESNLGNSGRYAGAKLDVALLQRLFPAACRGGPGRNLRFSLLRLPERCIIATDASLHSLARPPPQLLPFADKSGGVDPQGGRRRPDIAVLAKGVFQHLRLQQGHGVC